MNTTRYRILDPVTRFDIFSLLWVVNGRFHRNIVGLARKVSLSGDGYMQLALPIALYFIDPVNGGAFLLAVVTAFAIERPLYWALKNVLKRPRPPAALPAFSSEITASDEFSFPSGHTAGASVLATLAVIFYGALALPLVLWALLVGSSRVVLGVHFPTDILAGAVLGAAIARLAVALVAG